MKYVDCICQSTATIKLKLINYLTMPKCKIVCGITFLINSVLSSSKYSTEISYKFRHRCQQRSHLAMPAAIFVVAVAAADLQVGALPQILHVRRSGGRARPLLLPSPNASAPRLTHALWAPAAAAERTHSRFFAPLQGSSHCPRAHARTLPARPLYHQFLQPE